MQCVLFIFNGVATQRQASTCKYSYNLIPPGPRFASAFHQVGVYACRILEGEKPADLPVQQSTKFEFIINLQTVKLLGLCSAAHATHFGPRGDRVRRSATSVRGTSDGTAQLWDAMTGAELFACTPKIESVTSSHNFRTVWVHTRR
jgi:hypothetical protein